MTTGPLQAESAPNNNLEEKDPFSRAEITKPAPVKAWTADTWYEEINEDLEIYQRMVVKMREPEIDPMKIVVREAMLFHAQSSLAKRGIVVSGDIGRA